MIAVRDDGAGPGKAAGGTSPWVGENSESSPQVELKSQFISMGEDLAVREARC